MFGCFFVLADENIKERCIIIIDKLEVYEYTFLDIMRIQSYLINYHSLVMMAYFIDLF